MHQSRPLAKAPVAARPTGRVAVWLGLCAASAALALLYFGMGTGGTGLNGALDAEKNSALSREHLVRAPDAALTMGRPTDAMADARQKRAALREALATASQRFSVFSNVTGQSILDLHLETAFAPEALSSAPLLAESFQKITRLQALQRSAAQTKADYFTEVKASIKGSGLDATAIDQQMADLERGLLTTDKLEQQLQGLESQTTTAAVAILEFARAELSQSKLVNGQLVFENAEKTRQMQRLMGELVRSSSDQNKASVRISELQQKQKQALESALAR